MTAVHKALRILEVVAAAQTPMSMVGIERATRLPRPTVHRILKELVALRYIERDPLQRHHYEGGKLTSLALDVFHARTAHSRRRELLEHLASETGEACYFGLLRGKLLHLIEHVESGSPLGIRYAPGDPLPAHCVAGGKLLLAYLDENDRNEALGLRPPERLTEHTICDRKKLHNALASIRESGVGIEDGEHIEGVVGIAVPVRIRGGELVGALGISAPSPRLSLDAAVEKSAGLSDIAARLSRTFESEVAG